MQSSLRASLIPRPSPRLLPGFSLSLGISATFLFLMVLMPLYALVHSALSQSWSDIVRVAISPAALASYRLTIISSALAAAANGIFGFLAAWTLVRYNPPGKALIDALVDLPFAIPGSVGGMALAAMLSPNGIIGGVLAKADITIAYTAAAVPVALVFSGLPFVIRSLQPVIEGLDESQDEAALLLGANSFQRFARVQLPRLAPALASGCLLAFIRGLGEFGTVVFVSGNIPFVSEVTTQVIFSRIDQYDRQGAAAISLVLIGFSAIAMAIAAFIEKGKFPLWKSRKNGDSNGETRVGNGI